MPSSIAVDARSKYGGHMRSHRTWYGTLGINQLVDLAGVALRKIGGRNGNDDRSRSSREFRTGITSFGTLTAAVSQSGTPADPRPQGRLRGAQTGQKRAKTRVKEIDLPKKSFRIRGGRAAELPPAHTRGLQLGGVTCGTLDRRSRAPDTRHYLLMACRVGGPNLVPNIEGDVAVSSSVQAVAA